jgi:hypothetical protein
MRRVLRASALCLLWLGFAAPVGAAVHFEALETLPPGEQYRQLSLMLMASAGAEAPLREALLALSGGVEGEGFDPENYTTPLARIVDPRSLLAGAGRLFLFAERNGDAIRGRMEELKERHPVLIDLLDGDSITADGILIRNAIADSVPYAGDLDAAALAEPLRAYRVFTLRLRNELEYDEFSAELERITGDAIASVGGKLDAYQRMFDEETADDGFDRHIEAAESIYRRGESVDPRADEMTEEILRNMILLESQPNN